MRSLMAPHKATTQGDGQPARRQVNNILQDLRGEQFRQIRNMQGRIASSSALSSHVHNRPTLPFDLIYPSQALEFELDDPWAPGPKPPKSWRSTRSSSILWPIDVGDDTDVDTPEWRDCVLSLLFTLNDAPAGSSSNSDRPRSRVIYPHPNLVPPLTLLCLQRVRAACTATDFARAAPHIPPHLRRALLRYTAIHAPLSQTELDALCQGTTHVDTELVVVEPYNVLRDDFFRNNVDPRDVAHSGARDPMDVKNEGSVQWDSPQAEEESVLRSLAILQSAVTPATMLTFPPTLTHLALIDLYTSVPLSRLPSICPLLVFLDLSYNKWLYAFFPSRGEGPLILDVKWKELRRLQVLGLRGCIVDQDLVRKVNKGRWEEVKIIQ